MSYSPPRRRLHGKCRKSMDIPGVRDELSVLGRRRWKCWAPPGVKFFHWLAHLDRCWTADRLAHRGLQHPPHCPCPIRNWRPMRHLLLACTLSRQVWHETLAWLRLTCRPPDNDVSLKLQAAAQGARLHDPARPMDAMEAPQRLRLRQSSSLGSRPDDEN